MEQFQMRLFKYEGDKNHFDNIRMIELNGQQRFVATDVTRVLGYKNTSAAITRHCNTRGITKCYIPTESGDQNLILIDESNIYRLIAKSTLQEAKKFEEWIYEEVIPQIRKKGFYGEVNRIELPNFIERYKDNYNSIPRTHFSVINELFITVHQELEAVGYKIPNKGIHGKQMMPDISVGKTFSSYIKANHPEYYEDREKYTHKFPDGRKVDSYMYPLDVLPIFRKFVFDVWFLQYADNYFKTRDPLALNYIPQVLGISEESLKEEEKNIKEEARKTKMNSSVVKKIKKEK